MAKRQLYDTPHRFRVQGAFLVAKGIEHDKRDIFEFFSVTQRSGYRMIEPGAPSRTYAKSGALETHGRKRKVTSEQLREADAILQDDELGIFYDVPGNKNGRLNHQVFIDSILEPVVKPWITAGEDFVLEEDGDSGHGPSKKNPVRTWKEQNGLESYFNCAQSHDLSVIEKFWAIPKMYTRKYPHWDDATLENLIREGWAQVSQEFINKRVQEMPDRLQAVKDGHGELTGY